MNKLISLIVRCLLKLIAFALPGRTKEIEESDNIVEQETIKSYKTMNVFTEKEATEFLALHLKDWSLEKNAIKRDFKFKSFVEAFSFMTAIALEAEKMNHHPDWSNSFNKVSIALTTHEASGLTQRDFNLASTIDRIFNNSQHKV